MIKRHWLLLPMIFVVTSCDRSDYVIKIKQARINNVAEHSVSGQVTEHSASGTILVDKQSAENMLKYGNVYIQVKFCKQDNCPSVSAGRLGDAHRIMADDIDLQVNFTELYPTYDYSPSWAENIACIKIDAYQGFMGRDGRSDWYCSVVYDKSKQL
jgi:hypothetical protein